MDFFRRVFASNSKDSSKNRNSASKSGSSEKKRPEIVIRFNEDKETEAELSSLWSEYQVATVDSGDMRSKEADIAFDAFLIAFTTVYDTWIPLDTDDLSLTPSNNALEGAASSGTLTEDLETINHAACPNLSAEAHSNTTADASAGGVIVLLGCEYGHPKEVLAGLTSAFSEVTKSLDEAFQQQLEESVAFAGSLRLLEAVTIASRARNNRLVLATQGCLPELISLMKVAVDRLDTLATIATMDGAPGELGTQRNFLLCLLAHAVAIAANFVDVDRHWHRRRERHSASPLSPTAAGPGLGVGEPGRAPLLSKEGLPLFIELLRVLRLLRRAMWGGTGQSSLGASASLTSLTLTALGSVLVAGDLAVVQQQVRHAGGLQVLLDLLGPPYGSPEDWGGDVVDAVVLTEELQLQLLALEVLREAVARSDKNVLQMQQHGGFQRLCTQVCWVAATETGPSATEHAEALHQATPSGVPILKQFFAVLFAFVDTQSLTEPGGDIGKLMVSSMLGMFGTPLSGHGFSPPEMGASLAVQWAPPGAPGAPAVWATNTHLQEHILQFLSAWMQQQGRDVLEVLRAKYAYDVLFGEYFFYWGTRSGLEAYSVADAAESTALERRCSGADRGTRVVVSLCVVEGQTVEVHLALGTWLPLEARGPAGGAEGAEERQTRERTPDELAIAVTMSSAEAENAAVALRAHVLALMEQAASLPEAHSSVPECRKLLEVLESWAVADERAVLAVAPVLQNLVEGSSCWNSDGQATGGRVVEALLELDAVQVLFTVAGRQQARDEEAAKPLEGVDPDVAEVLARAGNSLNDGAWQARLAVLKLLSALLGANPVALKVALRDDEVVRMLFRLLLEARARNFAMMHIIMLLKISPESHAETEAKRMLCTRYLEALPTAQAVWRTQGISLLTCLLAGIREVLRWDIVAHQVPLFVPQLQPISAAAVYLSTPARPCRDYAVRAVEGYVQIVSLLNEEYPEPQGSELAQDVLRTLTVLISGCPRSKAMFSELVGYDTLQQALLHAQPVPQQELLVRVLDMCVDGTYDDARSHCVHNHQAVPMYFTILRSCHPDLQDKGLDAFTNLLRDSVASQAACQRASLLSVLIGWFGDPAAAAQRSRLTTLLQICGAYSVSASDLRRIFGLLRNAAAASKLPLDGAASEEAEREQGSSDAVLLLSALKLMTCREGPAAFFELQGREAGITMSQLRWPVAARGLTFTTWLRRGVPTPSGPGSRLGAKLVSSQHYGCRRAGLLHCHQLERHPRTGSVERPSAQVQLPFKFKAHRWYCGHCGAQLRPALRCPMRPQHTHALCFGSLTCSPDLSPPPPPACDWPAMVRLYVDGRLEGQEKLRFPRLNEVLLTHNGLGGTVMPPGAPPPSPIEAISAAPFHGQLGTIYMFDDALSKAQVAALHSLGPNYIGSFHPSEVATLAPGAAMLLVDPKEPLVSKLIFCFNAQASLGSTLFDTVPGAREGRARASIPESVMLCITRGAKDILHCLGGVHALLPLLQLDARPPAPNPASELRPEAVAEETVGVLAAMIQDSPSIQESMRQVAAFAVMGHLLRRAHPERLGIDLVHRIGELLEACGSNPAVREQAMDALVLDLRLWAAAPAPTQHAMHHLLVRLSKRDHPYLRRSLPIPRFLDWVEWTTAAVLARGGDYETEAAPLLHGMQKLMMALLQGEGGRGSYIAEEEMSPLYILLQERRQVSQALLCMRTLMELLASGSSCRAPLVSAVEATGGVAMLLGPLSCEHELLRAMTLQVVGSLLAESASGKGAAMGATAVVGMGGDDGLRVTAGDVLVAVGDDVMMYPLTPDVRDALFMLTLGGHAEPTAAAAAAFASGARRQARSTEELSTRRSSSVGGADPREAGTPVPAIVFPCGVGMLLRVLGGCEHDGLRRGVLMSLVYLLEGSSGNMQAVLQYRQDWREWVVPLLTQVMRRVLAEPGGVGSWGGQLDREEPTSEVALVWRLMMAPHIFAMRHLSGGWRQVERTVGFVLLQGERGVLNSQEFLTLLLQGLLHSMVPPPSLAGADSPGGGAKRFPLAAPALENSYMLLRLVEELLLGVWRNWRATAAVTAAERRASAYQAPPSEAPPAGSTPASPVPAPRDAAASADASPQTSAGGATPEAARATASDSAARLLCSATREAAEAETEARAAGEVWDDVGQHFWRLAEAVWVLLQMLLAGAEQKAAPPTSLAQRAAQMMGGSAGGGGKATGDVEALRRDNAPRVATRLVLLYLHRAPLEAAARAVQQMQGLLGALVALEAETSGSRLHRFLAALLELQGQVGNLDSGARSFVISQLTHATVQAARHLLAAHTTQAGSVGDADEGPDEDADPGAGGEGAAVRSLLSAERVAQAAQEEMLYSRHVVQARISVVEYLRTQVDSVAEKEAQAGRRVRELRRTRLSEHAAREAARQRRSLVADAVQQAALSRHWRGMLRELVSEHGPWAGLGRDGTGVTPSKLTWKLDSYEDASRRRLRLKRDYSEQKAQDQVLQQRQQDQLALSYKHGVSFKAVEDTTGAPGEEPGALQQPGTAGTARAGGEGGAGDDTAEGGAAGQRAKEQDEEEGDEGDEEEADESDDGAGSDEEAEGSRGEGRARGRRSVLEDKVLVPMSTEEQVRLSMLCQVVRVRGTLQGRVEVLRHHLLVHEYPAGISAEGAGAGVPGLGPHEHQQPCRGQAGEDGGRVRRWPLNRVKEVLMTRYLLQHTAVEIFMEDRSSVFLNLPSERKARELASKIAPSTAVFTARRKLEAAERACERWRRRECSTFDYLMTLNTLAGRSYNDLSQYPVFPWILADYTSQELDLGKPASFRDLSKPVGALNPERLAFFRERFQFCKENDPDNAFYYGSHYSTAAFVYLLLVRTEPFTSLHKQLQGGKFDTERGFVSLPAAWAQVLENKQDMKELTPEFFYQPEFLENVNGHEELGKVELPPWAKGSAYEFVRLNREALEGDYVSENLDQWIDLIFGFRQRGQAAEEAENVFYWTTYEGAVNLAKMEDDRERDSYLSSVLEFGQTPAQLFRRKHPKRSPVLPATLPPLLQTPPTLQCTMRGAPISASSATPAIVHIALQSGRIVAIAADRTLSSHRWITPSSPASGTFTFVSGGGPGARPGATTAELPYAVEADTTAPRRIAAPEVSSSQQSPGSLGKGFVVLPGSRLVVCCDHWDYSFRCIAVEDGRPVQSLRHHKDVVTCVAMGADGETLVTGSHDTTLMVWQMGTDREGGKSHVGRFPIRERPCQVLYGHDGPVTCVDVSTTLDLVVSGAEDGRLLFHTVRRGRHLRTLRVSSTTVPDHVSISAAAGLILTYSHKDLSMHTYTVNGQHVASADTCERLNALATTNDGKFVVTGGEKGIVIVRHSHNLQIHCRFEGAHAPITALAVTEEQCFVVGLADGSLLLWSPCAS
ncbi:hypothetical protein CYMTET_54533 [Cymbomonas tetramitiformis]|uniref:Uncharacterized protein n=1 Tax=Cymbomonas tetramitiformis TaxID=36881 RepID=A0AAE0BFZ4_9CHLO|nr:hypothetical protein CYMTET_54533 [Cymbomonas tetramitiformis]